MCRTRLEAEEMNVVSCRANEDEADPAVSFVLGPLAEGEVDQRIHSIACQVGLRHEGALVAATGCPGDLEQGVMLIVLVDAFVHAILLGQKLGEAFSAFRVELSSHEEDVSRHRCRAGWCSYSVACFCGVSRRRNETKICQKGRLYGSIK